MKLHVPLEVLKQYAEILKLRMVLKVRMEGRQEAKKEEQVYEAAADGSRKFSNLKTNL